MPPCRLKAGASRWAPGARAWLPQGTRAGPKTSEISASPGVTPAAYWAVRRGQKPRGGEQTARTATVHHQDFMFVLHAVSM